MVARTSPAAAKQAGEAATERWWHSRRRVAPIAAALALGAALAVTGWFVTARLWEDRLAATQLGMVAENRVPPFAQDELRTRSGSPIGARVISSRKSCPGIRIEPRELIL